MFHSLPLHQSLASVAPPVETVISLQNFGIALDRKQVLSDITFDLRRGEVLGLIGRAGAGKSALLRAIVRLLDESRGAATQGRLRYLDHDIYDPHCDLPHLRRMIAFVPQQVTPFPTSIWDNIAYGARLHRIAMDKASMADLVEETLRRCHLWHVVRDDLHRRRGTDLPVHQQRLLCLARALAVRPEVLLLDRTTGSIDQTELALLNQLVGELKADHTIVLVTPTLAETAQIADRVAHLEQGRLVEIDTAEMIFTAALHPDTRTFIDSTAV
ncbi:phosphate ABC transporter ATP-binding protein [Tritonibacter horizontis]|uniref:Phosphate import ATP-binding protein PstB n=1 Tax=Tritonibacter horizontis TaxID=1768241 RepID=A0A132BUJ3_9RHOB|nr:ATP-binding cassette domain-containing protein [Tritonibacter horizontis]KUP91876.1 phosphate import ATP-binding protein PstB [Tritonibacter horizontis]